MPFLWIGIGAALLALAVFSIAYYTYRVAFYVPKNRKEDIYDVPKEEQYDEGRAFMISLIDEVKDLPFEWVSITSYDGLKLYGRYYHVRDGAPLQIQFHGYRGTAYRDYCGGNKLARERGHNVLVIDQRAHGRSEGNTISFGINERYDCLSWIEYACERFGKDRTIILSGVSMGAATVLLASGLSFPDNVKAVIADSPYSSPEAIIKKVCKDMGFPPKLAFPFIRLGAKVFGKIDITSVSVVEEVKKAKTLVLIMHGEDDRFVPCEMSGEIYEAYGGEKKRYTFPRAAHGISYIMHKEEYEKYLDEFLSKYE